MGSDLDTTALTQDQIDQIREIVNTTPMFAILYGRKVTTWDLVIETMQKMSGTLKSVMAENERLKDERDRTDADLAAVGRLLQRMGISA